MIKGSQRRIMALLSLLCLFLDGVSFKAVKPEFGHARYLRDWLGDVLKKDAEVETTQAQSGLQHSTAIKQNSVIEQLVLFLKAYYTLTTMVFWCVSPALTRQNRKIFTQVTFKDDLKFSDLPSLYLTKMPAAGNELKPISEVVATMDPVNTEELVKTKSILARQNEPLIFLNTLVAVTKWLHQLIAGHRGVVVNGQPVFRGNHTESCCQPSSLELQRHTWLLFSPGLIEKCVKSGLGKGYKKFRRTSLLPFIKDLTSTKYLQRLSTPFNEFPGKSLQSINVFEALRVIESACKSLGLKASDFAPQAILCKNPLCDTLKYTPSLELADTNKLCQFFPFSRHENISKQVSSTAVNRILLSFLLTYTRTRTQVVKILSPYFEKATRLNAGSTIATVNVINWLGEALKKPRQEIVELCYTCNQEVVRDTLSVVKKAIPDISPVLMPKIYFGVYTPLSKQASSSNCCDKQNAACDVGFLMTFESEKCPNPFENVEDAWLNTLDAHEQSVVGKLASIFETRRKEELRLIIAEIVKMHTRLLD